MGVTSSPSSASRSKIAIGATARPARPTRRHTGPGVGWAFVAPAIILLLLLNIFPLIFSLVMSFSNVSQNNGLTLTSATLDNWHQLLTDASFWDSLKFTILFVFIAVSVEYVIGFGLAMLLWRRIPGGAFFRVLFSIPMMLAPVAIGFMWRMLFDESNGPIDAILRQLHLGSVPWLSKGPDAVLAVLIMDVWEWTPLLFLLLLAGLQALPEESIEAARLDGASGLRVAWNIILPILAPISVMAVFLRMVDAFTIFGQIFLLTGGGPGTSTTSTTLFAFFQGFQDFNVSYGSTISLALLVVVLIIAMLYLAITRPLVRRIEG
ncbi:MAG: carbohydrate ABC transporter permease [Chloroflexota bacterium]|nr:MAG: ABC transporter permease [Chloroflexota bacterium]